MVRFGRKPKRAIVCRTEAPFKKFKVELDSSFTDPDTGEIKHDAIEVLGDGQQLACLGEHPDTGDQYEWVGGSPVYVPSAELPLITEADAHAIVDKAVAMLAERFGIKVRTPARAARSEAPIAAAKRADAATAWGAAALRSACDMIVAAGSGSQETTLNGQCYGIGQLVGGGELPEAEALDELLGAAEKIPDYDPKNPWDDAELAEKVRKALRDGMSSPRAAPEVENLPRLHFNVRKAGEAEKEEEEVELIDSTEIMRMIIGAREEVLALADPDDAEDVAWLARMRQEIAAFSEGVMSARELFPADVFERHFIDAAVVAVGDKLDAARELNATVEATHIVNWLEKAINALIEQPDAGNEQPTQERIERQRDPLFKRISELKAKPREWLIKGFIPRNEVGNPFGRPNSFKGVAAAQLCAHIAGGVPFLEMAVKQMPTAYFAAERGEQAKRRIKGHIQRLGLPENLPCFFGDRPVNLLDDNDVELLLAEITAIERDASCPLGLLVIDTQSRTLDGDENSTKDGARYAKAIERIRRHTSATLWIIAHIGHAETAQDRPRGNSSLLGAYDVFYKFKKANETRGSVKITIDRDGLGQKEIGFAVELYDTGATNEDGEPVFIPYLVSDKSGKDGARPFTVRKPGDKADVETGDEIGVRPLPKLPAAENRGFVTLVRALDSVGTMVMVGDDPAKGYPAGITTVSRVAWRREYEKEDTRVGDPCRKAFDRAVAALLKRGLIATGGDNFWLTK